MKYLSLLICSLFALNSFAQIAEADLVGTWSFKSITGLDGSDVRDMFEVPDMTIRISSNNTFSISSADVRREGTWLIQDSLWVATAKMDDGSLDEERMPIVTLDDDNLIFLFSAEGTGTYHMKYRRQKLEIKIRSEE